MTRRNRWLAAWMVLTVCTLAVAGGCKTAPDVDESVEPTGPFADLQKLVPKSDDLVGWQRSGTMQVLVGEGYPPPAMGQPVDLSEYAKFNQSEFASEAQLFAEYKHRATVIQVFEEGGDGSGRISLEIHEMANADEAFGLLSVSDAGEPLKGTWSAGKKATALLSFVKDRFLVRAKVLAASATAEAALSVVGNMTATKIFGRGRLPAMVSRLPAENQMAGRLVYLHGPHGLRAAEKVLGVSLSATVGTVLGDAQMAAATYCPVGGKENTVFYIDRRMATSIPPTDELEAFLDGASQGDRNSFAYTVIDKGFLKAVVGTFNAEEESVQRVLPGLIRSIGG